MSSVGDDRSLVEDETSFAEDDMSSLEDGMSFVEDDLSLTGDNVSSREDDLPSAEDRPEIAFTRSPSPLAIQLNPQGKFASDYPPSVCMPDAALSIHCT